MHKLLAYLNRYFGFLKSRWFSQVSWVAAVIAPLPLGIQLFRVSTAPSIGGVALETYLTLAVVHFILMLRGIKVQDARITLTYAATSSISGAITIVLLIRGGKFFIL